MILCIKFRELFILEVMILGVWKKIDVILFDVVGFKSG